MPTAEGWRLYIARPDDKSAAAEGLRPSEAVFSGSAGESLATSGEDALSGLHREALPELE
jgi:hypothetical protein